jgi:hypothetical protein
MERANSENKQGLYNMLIEMDESKHLFFFRVILIKLRESINSSRRALKFIVLRRYLGTIINITYVYLNPSIEGILLHLG